MLDGFFGLDLSHRSRKAPRSHGEGSKNRLLLLLWLSTKAKEDIRNSEIAEIIIIIIMPIIYKVIINNNKVCYV